MTSKTLDNESNDPIYIALGLITVVLNATEIVLIIRTKKKKAFENLLLSLAVSDALVGITYATAKIAQLVSRRRLAWLSPENSAKTILISIIFSITMLLALTVDRFLAVKFPIKHRMIVTAKRANMAIIVVWLISLIAAAFYCLVTFIWAKESNFTLKVANCISLIVGAVILSAYAVIFFLISKRKLRAATTGENEKGAAKGRWFAWLCGGTYTVERSVLLTGCIVTISFVFCTWPFAFEYLFFKASVSEVSLPSKLMIPLNSLLNPIIYFFKSYLGSRLSRAQQKESGIN